MSVLPAGSSDDKRCLFLSDGRLLYVYFIDGAYTMEIWDLYTKSIDCSVVTASKILDLYESEQHKIVGYYDDQVLRIWDLNLSDCKYLNIGKIYGVTLLPNERIAFIVDSDTKTYKTIYVPTKAIIIDLNTLDTIHTEDLIISVSALSNNRIAYGNRNGRIKIVSSDSEICIYTSIFNTITDILELPNHQSFLISTPRKIEVWNIETSTCELSIRTDGNAISWKFLFDNTLLIETRKDQTRNFYILK